MSRGVNKNSSSSSSEEDEYDPGQVVTASAAAPVAASSVDNRTEVAPFTASRIATSSETDLFPSRSPASTAPEGNPLTSKAAEDGSRGPAGTAGAVSSSSSPSTGSDGGVRLHGIKGRVRCLCLSPSGTLLCAGGEDGLLCMWDFTTNLSYHRLQPTRTLTPFVNRIAGLQPIVALHCAVDGSYVVASQDGDCPALVASGGKQLGYCAMGERGLVDVVQCKGHRAPVTSSAAQAHHPAGFFTAGQDGTARLWDQASFDRRSVYAVKHGTGQLNDTVVVESVACLALCAGGSGVGSLFATGGQDGCVQLWDVRTKYRPGGALARYDVYALNEVVPPAAPSRAPGEAVRRAPATTASLRDDFIDSADDKHIGGMLELGEVRADGSSTPLLAVRTESSVKLLDLRAPRNHAGRLACVPITGLPSTLDTCPIASGGAGSNSSSSGSCSFVTCTSRTGYRHFVGGHMVQFEYVTGGSPVPTTRQGGVWCAGGAEEDVLCACVDVSREGGWWFAGLSSGDVVARAVRSGTSLSGEHPIERWLASRPGRDKPSGTGERSGERAPGQKWGREPHRGAHATDDNDDANVLDVNEADLF